MGGMLIFGACLQIRAGEIRNTCSSSRHVTVGITSGMIPILSVLIQSHSGKFVYICTHTHTHTHHLNILRCWIMLNCWGMWARAVRGSFTVTL